MIYRIKQFLKGLLSDFKKQDNEIIDMYLNNKEKNIFNMLPRHERQHALDTAFTIKSLNIENDLDILIKAALLHDVGKAGTNIGIIKKSLLVLMDNFFPVLSRKLSSKYFIFNIYYNHPKIGAEMLKNINEDERVIQLVRNHHSKIYNKGSYLEILINADSMN